MKKLTIEKINEYYRKSFLIITTIFMYIFIILFKNLYYNLYNINLNKFTGKEQLFSNIIYHIFAISISLLFFIKQKNKTNDELKKYMKGFLIGISSIIVYSLTSFIEIIILIITKINIKNMSITSKTIYLILCEIMIMSIITLINHEKLTKNIKDFKKNWKNYFEKYLIYYIFSLIIMIISNIFIIRLTGAIAGNEQNVQKILTKAPIYMVFSAVIAGPFLEEMIFRQSIRNIIKNDLAFIITSGLIFGGLHVIGNINTIYDILYIIPYSAPGIAFAYMLSKTDNIFVPMSIHFLHNLLLIIPQFILIFK